MKNDTTQGRIENDASRGRIEDPAAIRAFLEGGYAIFTLVSLFTGARFTYSAKQGDHGVLYSALSGPDNQADYRYIGLWTSRGLRPKDAASAFTPSTSALRWFLGRLYEGLPLDQMEFWHSGRCSKCARVLTDPESIAAGMGPTCRSRP